MIAGRPTVERATAERLTAAGIGLAHGFFTRRGGVSQGPWASLNGSLSGNDDPGHVAENRARIAGALGVAPASLLGLTQVHGDVVATVTGPWAVGAGPRADAMVTRVGGLALGVITADCAPVLFADAQAGVIGAAHAGWRGAASGVLEATLAAMAALGAAAHRIVAVVGPCIAQPSYEVGGDMVAELGRLGPAPEAFLAPGTRPGRWQFDLPGYCLARLRAAGAGGVGQVEADTAADAERFFSHRRRTLAGGGPIGHQVSAIVLPAGPR